MTAGVHMVRSHRPGKPIRWYIYAWRGGPRIRVVEQANRPKLTRQDIDAIAAADQDARTLPKDLVAGAIAAYRKSDYWEGLGASTRRTWGRSLDAIEARWEKVPMRVLSDIRMIPKIVDWRDEVAQSSPRTADINVTVLDHFFRWAKLKGLALHNPATDIPTVYRRTDRAPIIWLPTDLAAIHEHAKPALRDALDLAELTGLRLTDLVSLRWDEVGDFAIVRTAAKPSRGKRYRVTLPRLPALDALLDRLRTRMRNPGVETVLVNSFGRSWTVGGIGTSFHETRAKANNGTGIHHVERDPVEGTEIRIAKRLHDMRGTFATHLMTAITPPPTDEEIATLMGWSVTQVSEIRKRYVDGAAIVVALGRRLAGKSL